MYVTKRCPLHIEGLWGGRRLLDIYIYFSFPYIEVAGNVSHFLSRGKKHSRQIPGQRPHPLMCDQFCTI